MLAIFAVFAFFFQWFAIKSTQTAPLIPVVGNNNENDLANKNLFSQSVIDSVQKLLQSNNAKKINGQPATNNNNTGIAPTGTDTAQLFDNSATTTEVATSTTIATTTATDVATTTQVDVNAKKVYMLVSDYNYIANPQNKSDSQIYSEIVVAADPVWCTDALQTACTLNQSTHAFNKLSFTLKNQYFYYIYPAFFGKIDSSSPLNGFVVNNYSDNSWTQRTLSVNNKDGPSQKYYLYAYQSDDGQNLNYKSSGIYKISAP